jgi:hypothetical protein
MASRMVCVLSTNQIEIAQETLAELAGYIAGMCEGNTLPEYARDQIKEYIKAARQALRVYDLELRSDDDD